MALLPYGSEESVRNAPIKLNVARMIGNSEAASKPFARMANALVMKTKLDPKLREIAILRTAKDSHSVYEWTQHVPMAKHVGVTDAQVAAMDDWQTREVLQRPRAHSPALHRRSGAKRQSLARNSGGAEKTPGLDRDRGADPVDRLLGNGGPIAGNHRSRPRRIRRQGQPAGSGAVEVGKNPPAGSMCHGANPVRVPTIGAASASERLSLIVILTNLMESKDQREATCLRPSLFRWQRSTRPPDARAVPG